MQLVAINDIDKLQKVGLTVMTRYYIVVEVGKEINSIVD